MIFQLIYIHYFVSVKLGPLSNNKETWILLSETKPINSIIRTLVTKTWEKSLMKPRIRDKNLIKLCKNGITLFCIQQNERLQMNSPMNES